MGLTPLSQILKSFSAPISEEHGWGLIHQACVTLQQLDTGDDILLVETTAQLLLTDEGDIHSDSFTRVSPSRRRMTTYSQAVAELGIVVYDALDYSLSLGEDRELSRGLDHLIDMMTSADSDTSADHVDEGIVEDDKGKEIVDKVISLCHHHLAVSSEAHSHYRGVVRALVAESRELTQFMSRLDQDQLIELDRDEWGIIWTNVMSQLRQGVKLKKVDYSKTPREFTLTPYEMLMDDIRGKKYQLNPVKVPLEVQRGAREIILEFIRSRPPLKSVSHRKIVKKEVTPTPQEKLMSDIRSDGAKLRLRKTNSNSNYNTNAEGIKLGKVIDNNSKNSRSLSNSSQKKVIDLDESFAENILNFDDCEEQNDEDDVVDAVQESKDDEKMKLFNENNPDINKNISLQSIDCSSKSTVNNRVSKHVNTSSSGENNSQAPGVKSKYSDWIKNLHTLDLSLAEVAHIRSQLTKAELEEMDLATDKKREYEKGKICFLCGVVRFGIFTWAVMCQLCKRYVCSTCVGKITLPSDKLADILVCTLTTQLSKDSSESQSNRDKSPQNSLNSNFTRGYERHSFRTSARSRDPVPRETPRPRLTRARSMDKSMVASIQAMRLSSASTRSGIQHNVCKDCKDMLTSIVRAQRMAAKLDKMRGGFRRLGHGFDTMRE